MSDRYRHSVFISYSTQDRMLAERLAEKLRAERFNVWTDREILPGQDWQRAIETAIDKSDVIVIILSETALGSSWQQMEIGMALRSIVGQSKKVIPVLVSGIDSDSLPAFLRHIPSVKLDRDDEDRVVESITQVAEASDAH